MSEAGVFGQDTDATCLTWVQRELLVSLVWGNARLLPKQFIRVLNLGIGQRSHSIEVWMFLCLDVHVGASIRCPRRSVGASFLIVLGRRQTQPRACPPGFKSRSRRAPPLVFYACCSVGCVWGFWWFPPFELHVYSSMWNEAEAQSEYGVATE
jgi:hypothetical protein